MGLFEEQNEVAPKLDTHEAEPKKMNRKTYGKAETSGQVLKSKDTEKLVNIFLGWGV